MIVLEEETPSSEVEEPIDLLCPTTQYPSVDDIETIEFNEQDTPECRANFEDLLTNYKAE